MTTLKRVRSVGVWVAAPLVLVWIGATVAFGEPQRGQPSAPSNSSAEGSQTAPAPQDYRCECQDDPSARLDEDDEDKGLAPAEDRRVTPGKKLGADGGDAQRRRLNEIASRKVFFGNLHSHTKYSDGDGFPEDAFAHARAQGKLDFLAVTPHNHRHANRFPQFGIAHHNDRYEGPRQNALIPAANRLTLDDEFVALYGQEFSSISRGNHLCIFDVPRVVRTNDVANGRFDTLINDWLPSHLDSSGDLALVQLNHPWNGSCPNNIEYGRDDFPSFEEWRENLDKHASLIEVINGPSHDDAEGVKPRTINAGEFRRYLNLGFHLAPTANQDNHHRTWGTITDARTAVVATRLTKTDLLNAMRKRHVYASLDKNLRIVAQVEGELLGSILANPIAHAQELQIEIAINDDDEPAESYWVEVFADKEIDGESDDIRAKEVATFGPLTTSALAGESNTWELTGLEYDGWDYLYFRVLAGPTLQQAKKRAWTAPVWFAN